VALLLTVAVAASAARSLRPEWRATRSSPAAEETVPGGPPVEQH